MRKTVLLLASGKRTQFPDSVRIVEYLEDQSEARKELRQLEKYKALWLEPAPEISYFGAEELSAIEHFVRNGGGFVVAGGIGTGFLFRTVLEEMLPAKAVFQEDKRPQMSVRDIKGFDDSVWHTSGEIVVDDKSSPIVRNAGLKSGMKLKNNYVSAVKPGARVVARFNTYESVHSKLDLEPLLMPFISTWTWNGGRTVHIATDIDMLPDEVDAGKLISNVSRYVSKKPSRHEVITDRLAYYHGMMLEFHQRSELLAGMGIEPDGDDLMALRHSIAEIMGFVQNHTDTPLEMVDELGDGVEKWDKLLEGMEAEVFQAAFDSYRAFYRDLTQAEIDDILDEDRLKWLNHRGEMAKLSFNAKAYFEAEKQYSALCRTIAKVREANNQAGKP